MYDTTLLIHSWLRWVVLLFAIIVIFRSLQGWLGNQAFTSGDNRNATLFIAFMHLQLVIGLVLYFFLSPVGFSAFDAGMGAVMKNKGLRYWAVEHITTMILAVVLAQVGRTRSKRAKSSKRKHQQLAIFTIIAMVLVLSRIPWNESARLFRGL